MTGYGSNLNSVTAQAQSVYMTRRSAKGAISPAMKPNKKSMADTVLLKGARDRGLSPADDAPDKELLCGQPKAARLVLAHPFARGFADYSPSHDRDSSKPMDRGQI